VTPFIDDPLSIPTTRSVNMNYLYICTLWVAKFCSRIRVGLQLLAHEKLETTYSSCHAFIIIFTYQIFMRDESFYQQSQWMILLRFTVLILVWHLSIFLQVMKSFFGSSPFFETIFKLWQAMILEHEHNASVCEGKYSEIKVN